MPQPSGRERMRKQPAPNRRFLAATICFFRSEDAGEGGRSGITQFFLKEAVELDFVLPRVFPPLVDDEGGVTKGSVADGLKKSLKGLGVGYPNQYFFPIFLGQFPDPFGEEEVVFPHLLRVFIEVLVIPLVLQLQTQLV
jgi:hypothetical protein